MEISFVSLIKIQILYFIVPAQLLSLLSRTAKSHPYLFSDLIQI